MEGEESLPKRTRLTSLSTEDRPSRRREQQSLSASYRRRNQNTGAATTRLAEQRQRGTRKHANACAEVARGDGASQRMPQSGLRHTNVSVVILLGIIGL